VATAVEVLVVLVLVVVVVAAAVVFSIWETYYLSIHSVAMFVIVHL
jgi:hypothetical protein